MISGRTVLYGVMGYPVGHSKSPAMHNAAFGTLGIDAVYVALPVSPGCVADAMRGAHVLGFSGLNVTVPHKQDAAAAALSLDPVARSCGAANTLVRTTDGWDGWNTDAPACRELLEEAGLARGARALLLGAGGAALAGAFALLASGTDVTVCARRRDAADALCSRMRAVFPAGVQLRSAPWDAAAELSHRVDAVVNATSIGLGGLLGAEEPPGEGLTALTLRSEQVVADFVYGDTAFIRKARAAGARLVTGEEILVRQGALAFALWTGREPPQDVMMAAIRASGDAS